MKLHFKQIRRNALSHRFDRLREMWTRTKKNWELNERTRKKRNRHLFMIPLKVNKCLCHNCLTFAFYVHCSYSIYFNSYFFQGGRPFMAAKLNKNWYNYKFSRNEKLLRMQEENKNHLKCLLGPTVLVEAHYPNWKNTISR